MTADWFVFPPEVLRRISSRITNEVQGINRVTYDISSKPPAVSLMLPRHGFPTNWHVSDCRVVVKHLPRVLVSTVIQGTEKSRRIGISA